MDDLLRELVFEKEGSDLHLRVGEPPVFRVHGKFVTDSTIPSVDVESRIICTPSSLEERRASVSRSLWNSTCPTR
jgi:Tfp pilus assembly pilus retraction ATPase PilT